jgi:hypothetical protein
VSQLRKRVLGVEQFIIFLEEREDKRIMSKGNFKVKCLDDCDNSDVYTNGKVYDFVNGFMVCDDGSKMPDSRTTINTFEDWNNWSSAKWELVTEKQYFGEYISIKRCKKDKRVVAVMSVDGEYQKSTNVKLNDFGGDFGKAAKAAVEKLLDTFNVKEIEAVDKPNGFKAKCIKTDDGGLTEGKVYEFVNGFGKWDNGEKMPQFKDNGIDRFDCFADLAKWFGEGFGTDWEEVKNTEENTPLTAEGFKARDKVKVIAKKHGHCFPIGEILELIEDGHYPKWKAVAVNGKKYGCSIHWFVDEDEIEPYKETETPSFDWESFKSGKFAVHCDTEEKAREFLKECDEQGIKWCTGDRASESNHGATCYIHRPEFHGLTYGGNINDVPIIDYTPSKPTVKEVSRKAEVGEWIKIVDASISTKRYLKNGDIARIVKVDNHNCFNEHWAYYENKCGKFLLPKEYVVLENYQPPIDSKPEPEQPVSSTSMREVKREARVGEIIKVVNADSTYHYGYDNGDIIKVEKLHDEYFKNGVVMKPYHIIAREYVVLENFDYSVFPKNAPFVKAKVGDKIKVVKGGIGHGPEVKKDDVMVVDEVNRFSVGANNPRSTGRNWFEDKYQEYIIIEEAPEVKKFQPIPQSVIEEVRRWQNVPFGKDTTINIGDTVKVVDKGNNYSGSIAFVEKHAKDFTKLYNNEYFFQPNNGDIGVIIAMAEKKYVVLIGQNVFVMGDTGIEKVRN